MTLISAHFSELGWFFFADLVFLIIVIAPVIIG
jgi:hypothetical protein